MTATREQILYTPTWRSTGMQPLLGNGDLVGSYSPDEEWLEIKLQVGSTTVFGTGPWGFSLPSPKFGHHATWHFVLANGWPGLTPLVVPVLASDHSHRHVTTGSADVTPDGWLLPRCQAHPVWAAHPFTWASGDELTIQLGERA